MFFLKICSAHADADQNEDDDEDWDGDGDGDEYVDKREHKRIEDAGEGR